MMRKLRHIYRLGLKELISFLHDYVLIILVIYCFTVMVIVPSKGTGLQVRNSSVAYVDEDQSPISRRIINSIQMPFFQKPREITYHDINQVLDRAEYIFVLHIPSGFQKDLLSGKNPDIRIDVDATAIGHAKLGTTYLTRMINQEIEAFMPGIRKAADLPMQVNIRVMYNPNRENSWFMSMVFLTHMITLLAIILPAAALVKEKERGTVEHAGHAPCACGNNTCQGMGQQFYRGYGCDVFAFLCGEVDHRVTNPRVHDPVFFRYRCFPLRDNSNGCFSCHNCQESTPGGATEHAHYRAHCHSGWRNHTARIHAQVPPDHHEVCPYNTLFGIMLPRAFQGCRNWRRLGAVPCDCGDWNCVVCRRDDSFPCAIL